MLIILTSLQTSLVMPYYFLIIFRYLDDRVNRIIGFAVVRQVREKHGNCRAPRQMRDYVESCTGDLPIPLLQEDDR